MKHWPIALGVLLLITSSVFPHSGGTDKNGCHTNKKTGEYHCHGKPAPPPSPVRPSQTPASKPATTPTNTLMKLLPEYTQQPAMPIDYWKGKVVAVEDGDTITVLHGTQKEKVRLLGIDSPEKKQPFADEATKFTKALVLNKTVEVTAYYTDKYGRTVADIHITGTSSNLNNELVLNGWAWWFQKYAPDNVVLRDLEAGARKGKRGLWAKDNPKAPWEFRKE